MDAPHAESFALEPSAPRHGRQLFAHPLKFYESAYGTKERQLKNWVAAGRAADPVDLPPLDDPSKLPAWWARRFDRAVPEKITQAALRAATTGATAQEASVPAKIASTQTSPAKTGATPPAAPVAPSAPARAKIESFDSIEGMDLPSAVERQRKALAVLITHYEEALKDPGCDESTLTMRAGRVDKCIERLRKLEGTLDDLRKSRGELVDIADAREDIQRIHSAMASSLEGLLVDRLATDRGAARAFCDSWFSQLRQSRFFNGTGPAASAPPVAA